MSAWEVKDYAQLPPDYIQEDKAAARKILEEDTEKFLKAGGKVTVEESAPRGQIDEKTKQQLRKSLKFFEERNLTAEQKKKRAEKLQ